MIARTWRLVLAVSLACALPRTGAAHPRFAASIRPLAPAEIAAMRSAGMQKDGCPVDPGRLAVVVFRHWTRKGSVSTGRLVVDGRIADDVAQVMQALFSARFALTAALPIERYGGSDDRSMRADNTSAYNCRDKARSSFPDGTPAPPEASNHSYGLAIDLNPRQNPYFRPKTDRTEAWRSASEGARPEQLPSLLLGFCVQDAGNCDVEPESGRRFLDRNRPGLIQPGGPVVAAFKAHGFVWGGDWPSSGSDVVRSDLQHFEKPLPSEP
jgi:hypothetical protein